MEPLDPRHERFSHDWEHRAGLIVPGRRRFLQAAGLAAMSWMTPVGRLLADKAERSKAPAQSIIMIWLSGGPSQLETFDPKPGTKIAGGTLATKTAISGVQIAADYERLAGIMNEASLIRSMVSLEGDHERGTYLLKTGYRPSSTVEHPSIGSICCHELPSGSTGIPRHISILPNQWPGRGGFLGGEFDAFQAGDPSEPLSDVHPIIEVKRNDQRLADIEVVERAFAKGRSRRVDATLHGQTLQRARRMMTSDQLKAFEVKDEPASLRAEYGENPFGRACLAARRLTEVGVRCVEVTLSGWDAHVNNHAIHRDRAKELDPALAALIADLKRRDRLEKTVVLCAGEFGRAPKINLAGGRDHWPNGYSVLIAGGGIAGGRVIGETDPEGIKPPVNPLGIADVHATILRAVGLNPAKENIASTSRPVKLSEGRVIGQLLA